MAHSFTENKERVEISGLGTVDSSGNKELNGKVVFGVVDVSAYETNGVTLAAHNLGLDLVYGVQFQSAELVAAQIYAPVPAANGKSVVLNIWDAATPSEEGNGDNGGELSFIAWGAALGDI